MGRFDEHCHIVSRGTAFDLPTELIALGSAQRTIGSRDGGTNDAAYTSSNWLCRLIHARSILGFLGGAPVTVRRQCWAPPTTCSVALLPLLRFGAQVELGGFL